MNEIIARLEKLKKDLLILKPSPLPTIGHGRLGKGYASLEETHLHLGQAQQRHKDARGWLGIEED